MSELPELARVAAAVPQLKIGWESRAALVPVEFEETELRKIRVGTRRVSGLMACGCPGRNGACRRVVKK